MTQQKWVYVVDHRSPRRIDESSFANFIFPDHALEAKRGFLTAGTHGADFGELRALEQSIIDPNLHYGGVLHYRRALLLSDTNVKELEIHSDVMGHFVPVWSWHDMPALGWTKDTLKVLASKDRTILPLQVDVRDIGSANLYEQYVLGHSEKTLVALSKTWPLASDFIAFASSETKLIPFNMILASRENRTKLFDWLLNIIRPLEPLLEPLSEDPIERRWPGYLAERLSTFFWHSCLPEVKPIFVKTLRLDEAVEVTSPIDPSDYVRLAERLRSNSQTINSLRQGIDERDGSLASRNLQLASLNVQLERMTSSLSWRITSPARRLFKR